MYYISDICSLCLTEQNQNLKSVLSEDTDGIIIKEKLKDFLLELINSDKDIPKYICSNCLVFLNYYHKFRLTCFKNFLILNKHIKKIKTYGPYTNLTVMLTDMNYEDDHSEHEDIKKKIKNIEDTSIDDNVIVKQEYEYTFDEHQTAYDVFKEFNEEKHIIDENINLLGHNSIPENLPHERANEESESDPLEIAQKKEFNEEYVPSDASFEDTDDKEIQTLINSDIPKSNGDHLTNIIKNNVSTPNAITAENALKCIECQKLFKHRSNLFRHKLIHTKEKRFHCDMCEKQFNRSDLLTTHKRVHTGEKPFKCGSCDKAFNEKSRLTYHQRLHTGEIPYTCEVCNKSFNLLYTFKNHLFTHTGEKPYKCEVCDISFSHSSSFLKHKRIHTGEKPYKCDVCDKDFRYTHGLKRHKVKHTREKPYKCDVCYRAFQYKHVLKRHKLRHTEKKI